ncbi:hypothetical protein [Parasphingorhabdus sp.]|uniref:hypothetical protein n=1 Tax=Parasphingorhabdus sp. TaxID=2709688 RepID=UPI003264A368
MKIAKFGPLIGSAAASAILASNAAHAQEVNLNYDALSSLEEPLATDIGGITVELTGLVDVPLAIDIESADGADDTSIGFVGNFQISAETQLDNRWTLGVAYFGQYASDANSVFDDVDEYSDNVAGFVGTSFGTFIGGNTAGQVREQTRRARGVGNASLAFDNFYGGLDDWGGAYVGRFGPSIFSTTVDENGDFELGVTFQRPIDKNDIRLSARIANGRYTSSDLTTEFDTKGINALGEIVYGSTRFDLGAGYERLESTVVDVDRWFLSGGAQTQINNLTLSAEAHYGKVDGQSEKSASLGAAYAIGRGLSLNAGLNYKEASITSGGVDIVDSDEIQGLLSIRFSF